MSAYDRIPTYLILKHIFDFGKTFCPPSVNGPSKLRRLA
jgi:hypothetical protein